MGQKLAQYYKYIGEQRGLEGKTQLAMATKVPSTVAATADDSAQVIEAFRAAIAQLTGKPAPVF